MSTPSELGTPRPILTSDQENYLVEQALRYLSEFGLNFQHLEVAIRIMTQAFYEGLGSQEIPAKGWRQFFHEQLDEGLKHRRKDLQLAQKVVKILTQDMDFRLQKTTAFDWAIPNELISQARFEVLNRATTVDLTHCQQLVELYRSRRPQAQYLSLAILSHELNVPATQGEYQRLRDHLKNSSEQALLIRGYCLVSLLDALQLDHQSTLFYVTDNDLQTAIETLRAIDRDKLEPILVDLTIQSQVELNIPDKYATIVGDLLLIYYDQILNQISKWISSEHALQKGELNVKYWERFRTFFAMLPLDPSGFGNHFYFETSDVAKPMETGDFHLWMNAVSVEGQQIPSPTSLLKARSLIKRRSFEDTNAIEQRVEMAIAAWREHARIQVEATRRLPLLERRIVELDTDLTEAKITPAALASLKQLTREINEVMRHLKYFGAPLTMDARTRYQYAVKRGDDSVLTHRSIEYYALVKKPELEQLLSYENSRIPRLVEVASQPSVLDWPAWQSHQASPNFNSPEVADLELDHCREVDRIISEDRLPATYQVALADQADEFSEFIDALIKVGQQERRPVIDLERLRRNLGQPMELVTLQQLIALIRKAVNTQIETLTKLTQLQADHDSTQQRLDRLNQAKDSPNPALQFRLIFGQERMTNLGSPFEILSDREIARALETPEYIEEVTTIWRLYQLLGYRSEWEIPSAAEFMSSYVQHRESRGWRNANYDNLIDQIFTKLRDNQTNPLIPWKLIANTRLDHLIRSAHRRMQVANAYLLLEPTLQKLDNLNDLKAYTILNQQIIDKIEERQRLITNREVLQQKLQRRWKTLLRVMTECDFVLDEESDENHTDAPEADPNEPLT